MFEVGKYYKLVTWHSSDGGKVMVSSPSRVIDVSLPLVKFRAVSSGGTSGETETIVNTASLAFVRAELIPDPSAAKPEMPSVIVGKL
jgi:hypothetical protein